MSKINSNTPKLALNMNQQTVSKRTTTNNSFGATLKKGLAATANVVGGAVTLAGGALPGKNVISAALSGLGSSASALTAGNAGASAVGTAGGGGGGVKGIPGIPGANTGGSSIDSTFSKSKQMFEMQAGFNLKFLELQNKMQHESRSFQTVSNVMKNRTDSAKNAIRNMT